MCKNLFAIVAALLITSTACSKTDKADGKPPSTTAPAAPAKATAQAAAHAGDGVVPGSHDDWCGEHAVPESQCTRCNPDLIAAFKATGDWCAEHGMPESQCLACNPGLTIVRPPKTGQ
jgi:hypothetical protein